MVILTVRVSISDDIARVCRLVDEVTELSLRPIVHIAGLSAWREQQPAPPPELSDLATRLSSRAIPLWNGGWSGVAGGELTPEELRSELGWSQSNRWGSSFPRLLDLRAELDFPMGCTAHLALATDRHRPSTDGPLCAGYQIDHPSMPAPAGVRPLWFLSDGRWSYLRSLFVRDELPTGIENRGFDVVHLHTNGGADTAEALLAQIPSEVFSDLNWRDLLRPSENPPDGAALFSAGGAPRPHGMDPALLTDITATRGGSGSAADRTRRVLTLLDHEHPEAATNSDRRASITAGPNRFENRELQGGVTGELHLDTEDVGAVFHGGRLGGFTLRREGATPLERCQGYIRYRRAGVLRPWEHRFMETGTSAWFTGLRVRGVHEHGALDDVLELDTTVFALEDHPGVHLNFRVAVNQTLPPKLAEAVLIEVPLADREWTGTPVTAAVEHRDGSMSTTTLLPATVSPAKPEEAQGSHRLYWGRALRIDLPAGEMWIAAVDGNADPIIPFTVGWRPGPCGVRLVWYPLGHQFSASDPALEPRTWTASYSVSSARDGGARQIPDGVRLRELSAELDGFSIIQPDPKST